MVHAFAAFLHGISTITIARFASSHYAPRFLLSVALWIRAKCPRCPSTFSSLSSCSTYLWLSNACCCCCMREIGRHRKGFPAKCAFELATLTTWCNVYSVYIHASMRIFKLVHGRSFGHGRTTIRMTYFLKVLLFKLFYCLNMNGLGSY